MNILKEPAVQHIFCAWVEDWEQVARKNNDIVAETQLLPLEEKIKLMSVGVHPSVCKEFLPRNPT
jgi:hypothetical protein